MIIDLTTQEPFARVVRLHFYTHKGCWEEADRVCAVLSVFHDLPVEECRMDVHLVPYSKQVPVYLIAHAHTQVRQVTEDVAINRWSII